MTQSQGRCPQEAQAEGRAVPAGETPMWNQLGDALSTADDGLSGGPGKGFVSEGAEWGEGAGENPRDQETGISKGPFWKAQSRDSVT